MLKLIWWNLHELIGISIYILLLRYVIQFFLILILEFYARTIRAFLLTLRTHQWGILNLFILSIYDDLINYVWFVLTRHVIFHVRF